MPLNLGLREVSVPGSRVGRTQAPVGQGLADIGRSLSQSAQVLKSLAKGEDDLVGMQLASQYSRDLRTRIQEIEEDEPNPLKQRQAVEEGIIKLETQYVQAARQLNVKKSFSRRALPLSIAAGDKAAERNTAALATFADTNITISENLTKSNLLDPETQRIATQTTMVANNEGEVTSVTIGYEDPGQIAAQLFSHFETIQNNAAFLEDPASINERLIKYGQDILETTLESAARNSPQLFKSAQFKGASFTIPVPVIDPSTGEVKVVEMTPTPEQLLQAKTIADQQSRTDRTEASALQASMKVAQDQADQKTLNELETDMLDPAKTPGERFNLFQEVREGKHEFLRSENQSQALTRMRDLQAQAATPTEDLPFVVNPIQEKLFFREPVSTDDMQLLKLSATPTTYGRLYSQWLQSKDRVQTEIDKYQAFSLRSIRGILGDLPGRAFNKQVGIVADAVTQDFMGQILTVPQAKRTIDFINKAKNTALSKVVEFIAEDSNLSVETLDTISPFEDIPALTDTGKPITGVEQIFAAFRNPRDTRITTSTERDNHLFRFRLKKAIQATEGAPPVASGKSSGNPQLDEWIRQQDILAEKLKKQQERLKGMNQNADN